MEPVTTLMQEVGNRVLRLDPETLRRLGEMDGKAILLRLRRGVLPPLDIWLLPSEAGLELRASHDKRPDVTISAEASLFARLALSRLGGRPLAAGELQLSGDIELGQRFQRVLERLDIDWEEQLARRFGDVVAHQLWRGVRAMSGWSRRALDTLAQDATEYLQEEARVLARRAQVETFLDAVDTLRADAERFEQRLTRARAKLA